LSASLLIILNEHGQVLSFEVVPSDSRSYLGELLKEIWTTPGLSVNCEAVYTDNPKIDKGGILNIFGSIFPDDQDCMDVCLDVFHAKNRVVRELQRNHADYKAAVSDLSKIFGQIINRSFEFKEDLAKAFQQFGESYSNPTTKLSKNEKLLLAGT
jgi:hypothetical protein